MFESALMQVVDDFSDRFIKDADHFLISYRSGFLVAGLASMPRIMERGLREMEEERTLPVACDELRGVTGQQIGGVADFLLALSIFHSKLETRVFRERGGGLRPHAHSHAKNRFGACKPPPRDVVRP